MLPNSDPLFFYASFKASQHFGSLIDLQTFAFGQGFGGFQHPTILNPFWWVFDWTQSVVLSYYFTIAVLLLSVATYYRALGATVYSGLFAGPMVCVVFFNAWFIVDFFGPVAPQAIVQIGFVYFGLATLTGPFAFFPRMLVGLILLGWSVLMDWQYAVFLVPFIAINLAVCAFCMSGTRRLQLAAAVLFGMALFYAAGIYDAYDGYTLMSKRLWGPTIMEDLPKSLLIFGGWPGLPFAKTFGILAGIGTFYCIAIWRGRVSFLAVLTAIYVATLALADLDAAGSYVYWSLPIVGYFERPLIPLYVIFITYAVSDILRKIYSRRLVSRIFPNNRIGQLLAEIRQLLTETAGGPPRLRLRSIVPICLGLAAGLVFVIGLPASQKWTNQIRRLPVRWEATEAFIKELGTPAAQGHELSPYFFDTTTENAFYNCRSLGRYEWFNRYCGHMMNILSSRTFVEFHNI